MLHKNLQKLLDDGILPERLPAPNNETIEEMIRGDLTWWVKFGISTEVPSKRHRWYNDFLTRWATNIGVSLDDVIKKFNKDTFNLAEIAGGPFGGILDIYFKDANSLTQIDLLADKFEELNWKTNCSHYWLTSPAEHILDEDNQFDFLIGFNSIDHGWDIKASIDECIRVSKAGVLSFDTNRYKLDGYPDRSHYQIVDLEKCQEYISNKSEVKSAWTHTASAAGGTVEVLEFYWEK